MSRKFEYIDGYLEERGLKMPQLEVLTQDPDQYNTLVYQHKGEVEAQRDDITYIKNKNKEKAYNKFKSFFEIAESSDSQLVLTPEYSCPWGNISSIIDSDIFPSEGSLWIIGCESIVPSQLKELINKYQSDSIKFIYEDELLEESDSKFLDPVCYFFKVRRKDSDEIVNTVVIQFKTYPMGDAFEFEMDNMLRGTQRYIIRNSISSIYLITLICSESLDFNWQQDELNFTNQPYIIFHPQLNSSPRAKNFRRYRTKLYNKSRRLEKDTICLNWARGTEINGDRIELSCSAIYTKSKAVTEKIDEKRICNNDELGLYYNYWDSRTGIFTFDSDERIYSYSNFKASQRTEPAQVDRARRGPQMDKAYEWKDECWKSVGEVKNLELRKFCSENLVGDFNFFLNGDLSPLNKERLLSLSTGQIDSENWTHPKNNLLFQVSDDEIYNRIAVFQDPVSKTKKGELLNQYDALTSKFIKDPDNIPNDSQLTDLKDGCSLKYIEENLNSNVISKKEIPASLVYAGDVPESKAVEIKDIISTAVKEDNGNAERVLVWHQKQGSLNPVYEEDAPSAYKNDEQKDYSYKKTSE